MVFQRLKGIGHAVRGRATPVHNPARRRRLGVESLEPRRLLAAYLWAPDLSPTVSAMPVSAAWSDAAGDAIAPGSDTTAPTINVLFPNNGEARVRTNANLGIGFSEPVVKSAGSIDIIRVQDGAVTSINVTSSNVILADTGGTFVTIDPNNDLEDNTEYSVIVRAETFRDLAGNPFAGLSTWNFTTDNPPIVAALDPSPGTAHAPIDQNLSITFSENIYKGSGFILLKLVGDHSIAQMIDVESNAVTISGNIATIDFPADLIPASGYYVQMPEGTFKDSGGNNFSGITDTTTWNFDSGETHPPTLQVLSPANGATDIPVNTALTLQLNENVVKGDGDIVVRRSDGVVAHEIDVQSSAVVVLHNVATITLTGELADSTTYYVEVPATAFKDLSGNHFAGFSGPGTWSFTTVAVLPTATITVDDEALKSGETSLVTITFSEAVTGFANDDLTVPNGALTTVASSDGGVTWTATLTPAVGVEDADNQIALDNTGVLDLGGNAGIGTTQSNNYQIDTMAPVITGVWVDGVDDVAAGVTGWSTEFRDYVDGGFNDPAARGFVIGRGSLQSQTVPWLNVNRLKVQFSENVASSITAADFSLTRVAGWDGYHANFSVGSLPQITQVNFNATTRMATIDLNGPLQPSVIHLRAFSAGIADAAGNALDGEWTDGSKNLASGNGMEGGDFVFRLFVLPGDAIDAYGGSDTVRVINAQDAQRIFANQNAHAFSNTELTGNYDPRLDLDGNSVINAVDAQQAFRRQNSYLWEQSPTTDPADFDPSDSQVGLPPPTEIFTNPIRFSSPTVGDQITAHPKTSLFTPSMTGSQLRHQAVDEALVLLSNQQALVPGAIPSAE